MYDPDLYDTYSQFQRRDAKELVPYIVSKMSKKNFETVLDFGCGTGFNTKNIILPSLSGGSLKHNSRIYAVDVSSKMIEFASVMYAHPNVTFMVADVMKNDCEFPCKFDKIFSLHVLHWILDHEKALRSLYNLLKPNGEIAFYYISKAAVFSVYEAMSTLTTWKSYLSDAKDFIPKSHFSSDPAKDMHEQMTSIGYFVQEATNRSQKFSFDSFNDMIEAAMAANPFVHRIPSDLQDLYKEDFQKCFTPFVHLVGSPSCPDSVEVDYNVVLIRARKIFVE